MSADQREADARLVEVMIGQYPWKDHPHARMALSIASRAIRRGRHLTEAEKLENLAKAFEDDAAGETPAERQTNREAAARLREMIACTESASARDVPGLTNGETK